MIRRNLAQPTTKEENMSRMRLSLAALPALLAFAACSPAPPPPAQTELVPPPPQGAGPVVWQPGHWQFSAMNGGSWVWATGHYVPPPTGHTTWVAGRWLQQPSGSWAWLEGHWA